MIESYNLSVVWITCCFLGKSNKKYRLAEILNVTLISINSIH